MPIEIRQTVVTPDANGASVQIGISDAALEDASASLRITILARMHHYEAPALAHYQRAAMRLAQDAMSPLLQNLAREIQNAGIDLNPHERG